VHIKYPFTTILWKNFVAFCVIALLFKAVSSVYSFLLNQWVWYSISLIVFFVCTGGIVFCMLNNSPLFRFDRNEFGSVYVKEYFMRGQRGQYAGEGYIASALFTCIGLSYLFLANTEKFCDDKTKQRGYILMTVVGIYALQTALMMIYQIKSPWFNPGFSPPDYYQRGSLLQDQGNNI